MRVCRDLCKHVYISIHIYMGAGQNRRLVTRPGPTHDIPRYKGYVTGARLARQARQYHEYSKSFIAARQRATRGM